jgi:hypothetical protein
VNTAQRITWNDLSQATLAPSDRLITHRRTLDNILPPFPVDPRTGCYEANTISILSLKPVQHACQALWSIRRDRTRQGCGIPAKSCYTNDHSL